MANRKLPLGYELKSGRIAIVSLEAEIVRNIFRLYQDGMSVGKISERLNTLPLPCPGIKSWSKASIARILRNEIYIGNEIFKQIVPQELFESVSEKLTAESERCGTSQAKREIRKLQSVKSKLDVEDTVCALLNQLIENPEQIHKKGEPERTESDDSPIANPASEPPKSVEDAFGMAVSEYESIGSDDFEDYYLQTLLGGHEPMSELDIELMKATVKEIEVKRGSKVRLTLKNDYEIRSWEKGRAK